jgi:hypothetical protein
VTLVRVHALRELESSGPPLLALRERGEGYFLPLEEPSPRPLSRKARRGEQEQVVTLSK